MQKNELAAQGYTIRNFFKDYEEADQSFAKVKGIGYGGIQLSAVWHLEPGRLKELADKNGLKIAATHIGFDKLKNDMDGVIAEHKLMDCKYVGLGGMPKEARESAAAASAFAKEAGQFARTLRDAGLTFIYHNHSFEFADVGGKTIMDILFEECDPAMEFEIDTYWIQHGGRVPAEYIKKASGRLSVVHYKDMKMKDGQPIMCEVGEGILDWPAIVKASREAGVKWFCVEQDVCERDPFDCLKTSFENLLKM